MSNYLFIFWGEAAGIHRALDRRLFLTGGNCTKQAQGWGFRQKWLSLGWGFRLKTFSGVKFP